MRLAFIGLGVMGFPMAGHLARAGHEVAVFNRSPEKARRWAEAHGGRACAAVAEAVEGAEAVMLCVGNDADVREVLEAAFPAMAEGAVVVDHTTTSARLAREAAADARTRGLWFVDAPVSGGQAGAEAGKLSVMLGGEEEPIARVTPALEAYAKAVTRIGPPGAGQTAKMINQICIAGVVQGLAEAVHFAARTEVDAEAVYGAISQGAAQSWQMDNRWLSMVEGRFDFGFAVDWMRKDLGLVLEEARGVGATLPLTALVDQFYAEVQGLGGRRWDTSSLLARLERPDGLGEKPVR
ncbi:MAG TPA: NAD(P)-dependent oxidoreductase [Caulobacteraceae bacterium]|jgi:3-hydroxyisobutyrate dehydrogenase